MKYTYNKQWRQLNKVRFNNYIQNKYKTNINFRLFMRCRGRVRAALKGYTKSISTMTLIGCSPEQLKHHLESQFTEGMSWENYGVKGWHVDHIIPCVSFDLSDPDQQRECFHYTNLQPLWWYDNLSKGDKII